MRSTPGRPCTDLNHCTRSSTSDTSAIGTCSSSTVAASVAWIVCWSELQATLAANLLLSAVVLHAGGNGMLLVLAAHASARREALLQSTKLLLCIKLAGLHLEHHGAQLRDVIKAGLRFLQAGISSGCSHSWEQKQVHRAPTLLCTV